MPLRKWVLKNFWMKLISLALATVVWFTFSSGDFTLPKAGDILGWPAYTRVFLQHPVTVARPGGDLRLYRVQPEEVDVEISGDPALLREISGRDIHAFVDPSGVKEAGTVEIQISAPPEVRAKATPPKVRLEILKPTD